MHEVYEENLRLEHEMTELLGELQRAAQRPTFSYRLEEVHTLVVRLHACWTRYQRRGGCRGQQAHRLVVLSRGNTLASSRSSFCRIYPHSNPPELRQLELLAAGYLNHRERPVKPRPA